ncbi:MAG: efflux RND transporter periplasmic adaptor subunit [Melioribacteraceae bacterium]|nr:efflux RND transporter periplasmic adaptor subunit [Melioribacteraceae bacterium]
MNKRIFHLISFAMIFMVACSQQENDNTEKSVPVKIYKVKSESISQYIRVTGTVTAEEDVIVYSKISERIEKIYAKPGQRVTKDQVLAEQKNEIYKQGLDIANAALRTADLQVKMTLQDFERMNKLYSEKAISQQQYDQIKTAKETAEQGFNQAKSAYEQTKEQYENSFIKAPFAGVVAAVYVEENQTISMGQPVVQVLSPSKMKSKVNLTGADIQNIKAGQKVLIKFPTIRGEEFNGRVDKINSSIDQMSKSMEVEIILLSNDSRIKSGMFGEFLIETKKIDNSIVVPESALLPQTEIKIDRDTGLQNLIKKYYVFVVENGRAKLKEVKTGMANNGQIEITGGINIGDTIIVVGQNIVKEDQPVNVIE